METDTGHPRATMTSAIRPSPTEIKVKSYEVETVLILQRKGTEEGRGHVTTKELKLAAI